MKTLKGQLLASTFIPFVAGAGVAIGGVIAEAPNAHAVTATHSSSAVLPAAKPKPGQILRAACNPCNPCAAKNPCNPCAAANPCNPCNPCAGGGGAVSEKCVVPRLVSAAKANPCNPCAAKNPCNPCAAKNPCNPCAAKNPCNPCAAANPCNPCSPCGAAAPVDITPAEAEAVYACLKGDMAAAYAKAGLDYVKDYQSWANLATAPYQSATHGERYVNNYVNATGKPNYTKYEEVGTMPLGSVLAKDSFVVNQNGTTSIGPLFIMEKMSGGFDAGTHDWRYTMVMPNGSVFGTTGGQGAANVQFCAQCHATVAESQDSLFFLPEEFRAKF